MRFEKVVCDRCKKEIHYTFDGVEREIWLSGKGREGGLDLCDDCYNEMFKWFIQYHTNVVKIPENDDNFPNMCKTCKYNAAFRGTVLGASDAEKEKICKTCNRGTHYESFIVHDDYTVSYTGVIKKREHTDE